MTCLFRAAAILMALSQSGYLFAAPQQDPDVPFLQPVSVKFGLPDHLIGAGLKKTVADYNGEVYVLSDKGVLRVDDSRLIRDIRYTPLEDKVPLDISVREKSGHLYYLYDDHFLTNGYAGVPYGQLPKGKYSKLAIASDGTVLVAGDSNMAVYTNNALLPLKGSVKGVFSVYCNNGIFYALSPDAVYKVSGNSIHLFHRGQGLTALTFLHNELLLGTAKGYYGIGADSGDTTLSLQTKLPDRDIHFLLNVNERLWAATEQGGFMKDPKGGYRYYASKRWLNNDEVKGISADKEGNVYFLTNDGLNEIRFVSHTLKEKTKLFQDNIRKSHIRYGFISNVTLKNPGELSTGQLTDTDNDGLWSAFYLGSQAFRYAVTHEPEAKRYAWETFEAFERLLSVNPLKGFPARTFERTGYKKSDPEHWHDSQEKGWEWKGTTSSDEFVAYIWIAAVLHEMVAESSDEKKRVAAFIDKILTHIIDHGYTLTDANGKPTLWGRWYPGYINSFPVTVGDRRLGSTTIVAGLELGYALTGKAIYKNEALRLMYDYGYLKNIQLPYSNIKATPGVVHLGVDLGNGGWNHSDDEMAFLTYWVLYRYAFNKEYQQKFAASITDHWQVEKPERNAVWNLITLGTAGKFDKASTLWQLREFPMDLIRWNVRNSHRGDIDLLPLNFRNQRTKILLPPGEMPMHRHNANAFDLDGGNGGRSQLAGDEYLLPYWMARFLKVIR